VCGSENLNEAIDLGMQPIANNLLTHRNQDSTRYKLAVVVCGNCGVAQSVVDVPKDELFRNYSYKSSFSPSFVEYFKEVASMIHFKYNPKTLIEIGCNDGIFLKHMENLCDVHGIDPALNIVRGLWSEKMPNVINGYIEDPYAYALLHKRIGKVDVIYGANVFAHISDFKTALAHVKLLLNDDGVFIFEVQDLERLLKNRYFDMIYHEHYFYWTEETVTNALAYLGFEVIEIEKIGTHGGSLRVHAKVGSKATSSPHPDILISSFKQLESEIKVVNLQLKQILNPIKARGDKIIGYGAPAKASTLLNYFDIDNQYVEYIIDDSELKQGKFVPGVHIPIKKRPASLAGAYVIILAWNYAEQIMEKLKGESDVHFILPFPEPKLI
jgi:predicted TPR repeat methyltransferase